MESPLAITSSASAAFGFGAGPGVVDPTAGPAWKTLNAQLRALSADRNAGTPPPALGVRTSTNPAGLSISMAGLKAAPPAADPAEGGLTPEQARKTAEEFVSLSLVQPVLAQLRKTNEAWGVFQPGAYEKQFGPLMDAEIAMRMTKASNFPLVDAVARNLLKFAQRSVNPEAKP